MKYYKNQHGYFIVAIGQMASFYTLVKESKWEVLQVPFHMLFVVLPKIEITALEVIVSVGSLPPDL